MLFRSLKAGGGGVELDPPPQLLTRSNIMTMPKRRNAVRITVGISLLQVSTRVIVLHSRSKLN